MYPPLDSLGLDARLVHRLPPPHDTERWRMQIIGGIERRVAQPVTFTPYAAARPCSARCRFCSENLRLHDAGPAAATLRPGPDYFERLDAALRELRGLPLGYSLSGLEMTDEPAWFGELAVHLRDHARHSPVTETVLYTNGAGLADPRHRDGILSALASLPRVSIEWSRHHFEAGANERIMRFRTGHAAAGNEALSDAIKATRPVTRVKLVCVVQTGGIDSVPLVLEHLEWARSLGVGTVIFRELSRLDESYRSNATARYLEEARHSVLALLSDCLAHPGFAPRFTTDHATLGYYFWNLCGHFEGMDVSFEASDYSRMNARHRSGNVYKLVFHANGNLCAGWNPERDVLRPAVVTHARACG